MSDRGTGWIILLVIILIIIFARPLTFMGLGIKGPGMMGYRGYGPGMMGYGGYGYGFNWVGATVQIIVFRVFLGLIAFGICHLVGGGRIAPGAREHNS